MCIRDRRLRIANNAVLLSVDEIMLAVFGPYTGDKHDEYTEKIQKYLFEKSVEIINSGINVILDWGFWSKCKRTEAREFYTVRDIECEFYYIDISDKVWKEDVYKRQVMSSSKYGNISFKKVIQYGNGKRRAFFRVSSRT